MKFLEEYSHNHVNVAQESPDKISENLWDVVLKELQKKIHSQYIRAWIDPIEFVAEKDSIIELLVPNNFHRDWIKSHYIDIIETQVSDIQGKKYKVVLIVKDIHSQLPENEKIALSNEHSSMKRPAKHLKKKTYKHSQFVINPLNPKYVFDSFVVGSNCQFAHAASLACSEDPGGRYNPLFIYGGVGLGKTHLLNAVGHLIAVRNPKTRIAYLSAEQFINDLITSLRTNRMHEFRKRYRDNLDILLIDDVQDIAGKERTMEEFFHTFNTLYEQKKQLVMTSDQLPKDIPDLEDRLRSRFDWGLLADIKPPETETRIAILEKKAEMEGIPLPHDVALFLAAHIKNNVRELEGSLVRLAAFSSLTGVDMSVDLAKDILKNITSPNNTPVEAEDVIKAAAKFFNISTQDIKSHRKQKVVALPRQIAMYLARKHTKLSFPELGLKFGGKDHSTILYAEKKIKKKIETDLNIRSAVESIEKNIEY